MSDQERGNIERVLGAALSVPVNMINGLTGLLITKGVISHHEAADLLHRLIASVEPGEDSEMIKNILRSALDKLES
jgi:hypothetical protein